MGRDVTAGYSDTDIRMYLEKSGTVRHPRKEEIERKREAHEALHKGQSRSRIIRWWVEDLDPARIQIPTAHVHGDNDAWLKESNMLMAMCEPASRSVLRHNGGHEIPLKVEVAREIAELIESVIAKSNLIA